LKEKSIVFWFHSEKCGHRSSFTSKRKFNELLFLQTVFKTDLMQYKISEERKPDYENIIRYWIKFYIKSTINVLPDTTYPRVFQIEIIF
jgi:hypothetical protein